MDELVTLDYGSGGKKTAGFIDGMIVPMFDNPALRELSDGAVVPGSGEIVVSTDSFVVTPYVFPGGDIGKLAVCGTVNDVCMAGGRPLYLTLSLIIEEGFPMDDLRRILTSVRDTAKEAGVMIVTGDTKVVERGHADGIFLNTTGVGALTLKGLSRHNIEDGDCVIVSGPVGDHGTCVLLAREENLIETAVESDCCHLEGPALALAKIGRGLRIMRDPTRGGLATTLNELIEGSGVGIELSENEIPVRPGVRTACEILGLDPLYAACEGRLIAIVACEKCEEALEILKGFDCSAEAALIGTVTKKYPGRVIIRNAFGGSRIADKLTGAQLPRIC